MSVGSNSGFSLIEMMTALAVIALSLLVLSATLIHAIKVNVQNDLRDTAVRLTNHTAEVLLAVPFEAIRTCGVTADPDLEHFSDTYRYDNGNACLTVTPDDYLKYPNPVQTIKGFRQRFNITWEVSSLGENLRQVIINVAYRESNESHVHSAVLYRHRKP